MKRVVVLIGLILLSAALFAASDSSGSGEAVHIFVGSTTESNEQLTQALLSELAKGSRASVEVVEGLLAEGVNPNEGKRLSYPPLHYAIKYCPKDITLALLGYQLLDINILNDYGTNALLVELSKNEQASLEIVEALTSKGINPNVGIYLDLPPLHYAIHYCSKEIVWALFDYELIDIHILNVYDTNAFFAELVKDDKASLEIVTALIERGVDPNVGASWGFSYLQYAILYCPEEIILALIDYELLDVNVLNPYGSNALLIELTKDERASLEVVTALMERGVDPNVGISWGYPPLLYAYQFCSDEIVSTLLDYELIDVNILDDYGGNILLAELEKDEQASLKVVTALMERGVDPNVGTLWGYPPLHYAHQFCPEEIFWALLDYELIDVNILDDYGGNILLAELEKDEQASLKVVTALMERGVDPNMGTLWGLAPLDYAERYNPSEIFVLLSNYASK